MKISKKASWVLACLAVSALLGGCPPPQQQTSNVTVLFTTAERTTAKAQVVPPADVAQLLVSVNDVQLTPAGDGTTPISVLAAPQVVDLKELVGVAALLNRAEIPVGAYTSMRMVLASATLYLKADPATPITDVAMPDNGVFDVPIDITIADGQTNTVLVDLGGITLVSLNAGGYELTPDFHVRVAEPTEPIPARSSGEIQSIDLANNTYATERHDTLVNVNFSGAVIYLPSDGNSPTGTPADLTVGSNAIAYGTLAADGTIDADVVIILDAEDDHGGDGGHGGHGGDDGEGESEGEDEGGHEGESEGEDEGGHEGESEGEDEGGHEGESEGEDEGGHEGESEGEDEGGHEGESEGEGEDEGESEGQDEGEDGGHGGHGGEGESGGDEGENGGGGDGGEGGGIEG